jgi:hypothetical protein
MDEDNLPLFFRHSFSNMQRELAAANPMSQFNANARPAKDLVSGEQGHFILSKFGVGAKNAGFYLGSRIRVISKVRAAILLICA